MMIEHIALYVNDLEAARTFFMKYLGAASNDGYHNPKTDFRSYFLTFDDGARLELMHKPEMPDQPKELSRTGYAHIAFRVGSREKVDALTAELKADGYKVISGPRTTGDGYYESCIAAIEGEPDRTHGLIISFLHRPQGAPLGVNLPAVFIFIERGNVYAAVIHPHGTFYRFRYPPHDPRQR